MTDRLLSPEMVKMLFGSFGDPNNQDSREEESMSGVGKIVTCNHPNNKAIIGGVVRGSFGDPNNQEWILTVGTVIVVPVQQYVWRDGVCNESIEEILSGGLDVQRFWQPKKSGGGVKRNRPEAGLTKPLRTG
jgi:hypothetical protein